MERFRGFGIKVFYRECCSVVEGSEGRFRGIGFYCKCKVIIKFDFGKG